VAAPLHPQIEALLEREASATGLDGDGGPPDLAALRASYLQAALELGGEPQAVARVEEAVVADVPVRVYEPLGGAPADAGVILWHHGGGWVMGDLPGFDHVARELANVAGRWVVSVDYRLAPEHPHPAAEQDAAAVLRWAAGDGAARFGWDAARIGVGGDSAGAQVAVAGALAAPGLAAEQLLVYPALDAAMDSASYEEFADGPMLTRAAMVACWAAYLSGGAGPVAPLDGSDLSGLPPARIVLAGHDPLRDDGARYARELVAAGVPVDLRVFDDMTHGFLRWGGAVDRAHDLIAALAAAAN
jgi:acetyl esterase